jgi:uncharacterized protein
MKMLKLRVGLAAVGLFLGFTMMAPSASAASFDCYRARLPDERAICADRRLDDRDVELSVRYEMILHLVAMGQRGDLQDQQRAWLDHRHSCGMNRQCLLVAYDRRIGQLKSVFNDIASRGPF